MSDFQVLKRVLRLTPSFTMYCPYGLRKINNLSDLHLRSISQDSYFRRGAVSPHWLSPTPNSEVRGGSWGLTGRTHSPGLCSDTPRYSGSAGHSPPGAERSEKGSVQRDIKALTNLPKVSQPSARLSCPGAFAEFVPISLVPLKVKTQGTQVSDGMPLPPGSLPQPAALPVLG